jgi:tetraacyldisaccharide 4'-kinase
LWNSALKAENYFFYYLCVLCLSATALATADVLCGYMDSIFWRKLVTSQNPSPGEKLLRFGLTAMSLFYAIAVFIRNRLYDFHILRKRKVGAAVISVGNITTGGTGKTPLVAYLGNYFTSRGITAAILTRGYKAQKNDFADEPAMLVKACPKAKVMVNPDRAAGAEKAIKEYGAKLLIMDDGFQHRKLVRDVDIVAIDATIPFGRGKILPAGLLREPVGSLKRADAVVITRINQTQPENIGQIKSRISAVNPDIVFATAVHKPAYAKLIKDQRISLEQLAEKRVYAFCGIGNPDSFFQTLEELALNIVGTRVYNDHHSYTDSDIEAICRQGRYQQADMIITTQKDWIKTALLCMEKFDIPIAHLAVELEFIDGRQEIINLIESAMKKYV